MILQIIDEFFERSTVAKSAFGHITKELGMKVERFSLDNGWGFNLWSKMQILACRTPARQEALKARREHHHRRHLCFARRIYLRQVNNGRHAHLEQPQHALSWHTTALRDLPGNAAMERCASTLMAPGVQCKRAHDC